MMTTWVYFMILALLKINYLTLSSSVNPKWDKIIDKLRSNNLTNIKPVEHMDAVPLEIDGSLNKEMHKELFLGDHEDIENEHDTDKVIERLKAIFNECDKNKNGVLNIEEIEDWLLKQINQHLDSAKNQNDNLFNLMDTDKNGLIFWDEYNEIYDRLHGISKNAEDVPQNLEEIKREVVNLREKWTSFDTNKDNALNRDEFLLFRHPEMGQGSLDKLVDTIIENLDSDKDGYLKKQEFILIEYPRNEDERAYYEEKQLEYKSMDKNEDGIIDRTELKDYVNPRNERSIKRHAKEIIDYVDEDRDGLVSLDEILLNIQYFVDNRFLEPSNMIHYEL